MTIVQDAEPPKELSPVMLLIAGHYEDAGDALLGFAREEWYAGNSRESDYLAALADRALGLSQEETCVRWKLLRRRHGEIHGEWLADVKEIDLILLAAGGTCAEASEILSPPLLRNQDQQRIHDLQRLNQYPGEVTREYLFDHERRADLEALIVMFEQASPSSPTYKVRHGRFAEMVRLKKESLSKVKEALARLCHLQEKCAVSGREWTTMGLQAPPDLLDALVNDVGRAIRQREQMRRNAHLTQSGSPSTCEARDPARQQYSD